ncbi:MAG: flagellin FliC, partial [Bacteriovoracaceae bacterium]|nr:flagellin FliC [Bacteriovoracaceae bacterium]
STSNNLGVQIINQDNARSVIEDSDVAQATSALAAQGVMSSAGIATLSQANNLPNSALRLLG